MNGYVEKAAVREVLCGPARSKYPTSFLPGLLVAAGEVDKMPSADVVSVVRCKDCRWSYSDGWVCGGAGMMPEHKTLPGSFCDQGELKDGE